MQICAGAESRLITQSITQNAASAPDHAGVKCGVSKATFFVTTNSFSCGNNTDTEV